MCVVSCYTSFRPLLSVNPSYHIRRNNRKSTEKARKERAEDNLMHTYYVYEISYLSDLSYSRYGLWRSSNLHMIMYRNTGRVTTSDEGRGRGPRGFLVNPPSILPEK